MLIDCQSSTLRTLKPNLFEGIAQFTIAIWCDVCKNKVNTIFAKSLSNVDTSLTLY